MLKIGLFSKLSRVSIRMLRYYEEIGLLHPAYTDPESEYRYYREDQLPQIGWITALRDMGFSLADVCRIMAVGRDAEALAPFFAQRRRELEQETEKTARQRMLLDTAEKRLGKEAFMQYNVTIKTIPARYAACVHTILSRYEEEGTVWKTLCEETDAMHLVPDDPCYCAVTFLDGEYKERDVEVEAWKTVKGSYLDTEHVKFRTLPAVTVASCTFRGHRRMDRGQRLRLRRPDVQHLPRQPARDAEPRGICHRSLLSSTESIKPWTETVKKHQCPIYAESFLVCL